MRTDRAKSWLRNRVYKEARGGFVLILFLIILSAWFWGPILTRYTPESKRKTDAIIVAGILLSLGIAAGGGLAVAWVIK